MNADAFRHFYNYHFSENRKIWDRYVTQLSEEQFVQTAAYSHGSVRDQIVHLMNVDETWFSGLRAVEIPESPNPTDLQDRDSLRAHWDNVEQTMRDYLAALQDDMLFENHSQKERTRISSCGRCFCTWRITAQIIAPSSSDC